MSKTVLGFADFRDQERVVAVIRHHWWVLVREAGGLIILFIVPFFLIPIAFSFALQAGTAPTVSGGVVLFFGSAWALIIWHLIFARWTDYYYDIWVITNWRIIDIDQQGFFKRNVATLLTLDHIEDIETESAGIIASLLNFGHVQVETAAAERAFNIDDVGNPVRVEQLIRSAQEEQVRIFGYHPSPRHEGIFANTRVEPQPEPAPMASGSLYAEPTPPPPPEEPGFEIPREQE
jgi:hypothetical protein